MMEQTTAEIEMYLAHLRKSLAAMQNSGIDDFANELAVAGIQSEIRVLEAELTTRVLARK